MRLFDYMFAYAPQFNADISGWDVSGATDMTGMFYDASAFNVDLSKWDVSRVAIMFRMFSGATCFHQRLNGKTWLNSKAFNLEMFANSPGSLGTAASTSQGSPLGSCPSPTPTKSNSFVNNAIVTLPSRVIMIVGIALAFGVSS